jgi:hypothetical protein
MLEPLSLQESSYFFSSETPECDFFKCLLNGDTYELGPCHLNTMLVKWGW